MLPSFSDQLLSDLQSLRTIHRLRSCPLIERKSPVQVTVDGTPLVSFCSNDYLGLASHPNLSQAATASSSKSGFGASASRLVCGTFPEHIALEASLASLVRAEATLLFPSGYQANLGTLAALAGPDDLIVADRSVHASLIDACRLSRAKLAFYPHCDISRAHRHLVRLGPRYRRRLLVTETLFSMDGDVAPLADLAILAKANDAILVVDEAHAIGCLGPHGAGICALLGIQPDVLIGTLGKAVGASGAFVAGTAPLRAFLLNHSRGFLFTTALPPPIAAAASASLQILASEQGDLLRQSLQSAVSALRSALSLPPDPIGSPILPIILGQDSAALTSSATLRTRGFFVQAIRPPTVPEGTARLRVTLSAHHTSEQIRSLATSLNTGNPTPSLPISLSTDPGPPPGLFILGTDTSVGKTTIASAILHLLVRRGYRPVPFKPVETGTRPENKPSDAIQLQQASLRPDIPLHTICPYHFPDPLSPLAAAEAGGLRLTLHQLLSAAATAASHGSPMVVESAGGILTPYADQLTTLDLAEAMRLPVLLVSRNTLGTINHTALSIAEIRRRSLSLLGVILVHTLPTSTPDQQSNASIISRLTGHTPLGALPYLPSPTASLIATALEETLNIRPLLSLFPPL